MFTVCDWHVIQDVQTQYIFVKHFKKQDNIY